MVAPLLAAGAAIMWAAGMPVFAIAALARMRATTVRRGRGLLTKTAASLPIHTP